MSGTRPRVIFVNRVYWPSTAATAQLLTDLAEGLASHGWEVHVIAAGEALGPRNGVAIHRTGGGEKHGGLVSRTLNYMRFIGRARRLVASLARPGDIVVPMTDPPMLGAAVAGPALSGGASIVHWIQDIYPEIVTAYVGTLAGLALGPLRQKRDAAWRSARCCVTLGESMASAVAARGVPAAQTAIVPNWAPRELHNEPIAESIAARRTAWGLADRFIIAYSGNLGRVHEFAAVLDAAEQLRAHPKIVFAFIGSGPRFDEVRSAAGSRNLANIKFLPPEPREALAAALAAANAHLVTLKPDFASLVYPSKLAGVLAAGRPVLFVGPPAGDIARLLEREECGLVVAPTGGTRLAELIARLESDPALAAGLGRNARATYERHFTFDSALQCWLALLQQVKGAANFGLR